MSDFLNKVYQTHNETAVEAIQSAREKVAAEHGEEGLQLFDQFLEQIPEEEIFDMEEISPEKVAEEGIDAEKLAELDEAGRVFAHAFISELRQQQKIAEYVEDALLQAFYEAVQ